MKIAILGAPGSGKTWLARALADTPPIGLGPVEPRDNPDLALCATFDVVLLMGLDLCMPSTAQLLADASLRSDLAQSNTGFRVVYGLGKARLVNALHALPALSKHVPTVETPLHINCDKCSDPDCEHRLFSRLLQGAGSSLQAT